MATLNKRPHLWGQFEGIAFHLQITGLDIVYMNFAKKTTMFNHFYGSFGIKR